MIQLDDDSVQVALRLLLQDKTTKKNIIWATNTYQALGPYFTDDSQITADLVSGMNREMIQPRIYKAQKAQAERTKKHAEVFTPAWICSLMNNHCDEEWFGRKDVFNRQTGCGWTATEEKIEFPETKSWKQYVDSRRLEITCGEAPFLVSRYDAATGEGIPLRQRIGLLDRKLRIVEENAADEAEWLAWTIRAFQSVYGYEYQGDNLLIARINLLMTYVDALRARWNREPTARELRKVAGIIAWNLWQMDGLKGTVPIGVPAEGYEQLSMYEKEPEQHGRINCRVMDWRGDCAVQYLDLQKGRG